MTTARLRVTLAGLLALAGIPAAALGQDYVTAREVFLRGSPSKTGAKLRSLPAGDTVARRPEVDARPGWLPVRARDGKAGWIGIVHLRSVEVAIAGVSTTILTEPDGSASTSIDSTWAKPPIDTATIRLRGGVLACGPTGDAVNDDGTNFNKNRSDSPVESHLVTLDAIRSLPDTALWRFTNRRNWTADDSALVLPFEGTPVTVEGFFEIVKPQTASPPSGNSTVGESPNCHSWEEDDTDWHVALVADPSETEEQSVVIEPTPRSKRHAGWTPAAAKAIAVRRSPSSPRNEAAAARVRVTGFLMLDPVHPSHIRGKCTSNCAGKRFFRATLWEIHPVTRIEVFRNGTWVDLAALPP